MSHIRSHQEKIFLGIFLPLIIILYLVYKFPTLFVPLEQVRETFYFLGKNRVLFVNGREVFSNCIF